ncbi:MAG: cysteine desulfurase [Candidatus Pacebacteria bacterium]|nr:cysteine desulfurase [Candidatus Paceibacterota bacterium]
MPKSTKKQNKKPSKIRKIYLDVASGARGEEANPSAIHELGVIEKNKLEQSRRTIADILDARPDEIIFTGGATESNNLAILGMTKGHIVTTNIEHASVLETCKHVGSVTFVPVEKNGIVDPKKIKKAIRPDTVLVSVMYANNEIGTIQPIREIAKEIRHYRKNSTRSNLVKFPLFHTDATQAVNYLPIRVESLGVDMMSWNGAKIYGPKGVGALYVKRGTPIKPIMWGGEQEGGLRPGTENVTGIMALAQVMTETEKIKNKEVARVTKLRDYFISKLQKFNLVINGDLENRLPNNVNITIPKIPSDLLVIELSARGVMASAKSACKSGDGKASYVIEAINPNLKDTDGSLRFSLGRETTKKDIDDTIKALSEILKKLEKWYY